MGCGWADIWAQHGSQIGCPYLIYFFILRNNIILSYYIVLCNRNQLSSRDTYLFYIGIWAACGTTGITPIVGWCMGPMWGEGGFSGITGFGGKYMIGLDVHKRQKAGWRMPIERYVAAAHHLPAWRRCRAPRGAISSLVFLRRAARCLRL